MRTRILSPPFSIHFFAFSSDDDDDDDFRSSSFPNSVSVSAVVWKVLSAFYSLPLFCLSPSYQFRVSVLLLFLSTFLASVYDYIVQQCAYVCYTAVYDGQASVSQSVTCAQSLLCLCYRLSNSLSLSNFLSFIASITRQLCTAADDHLPARRCCLRTTTTETAKVHTCFFSRFLCFSGGEVFPLFFSFDQLFHFEQQHMLCVGCLCSLTMMAAMMSMKLN